MKNNILAFDIETIPDVSLLRQIHSYPPQVSDEEVVDLSQRLLRQKKNSDFFSPHLHRVVCISCVLRVTEGSPSFKVFSLPTQNWEDEAEAISLFFKIINKYTPTLVSWNGSGFDLPVLQYRAMKHAIVAQTYSRNDGDFKWNRYSNRYHERHTDLMDMLGMYQLRNALSLNNMALLCGLPGKIGIGGDKIWDAWQKKESQLIRQYCEVDVMLTYLLYCRFMHFRGVEDETDEITFIRQWLSQEEQQNNSHWQEFQNAWPVNTAPNASFLI